MMIALLKFIYCIVTACFAPVIFLSLRFGNKKPPYGTAGKQLLGFIPKQDYQQPIWFHTVSVGETMGAIPLIKKVAQQYPQTKIIVTTTTTTAKELYRPLSNIVTHLFAPLDSPCAVHRFLHRLQPKMLVIMETELWPNLLAQLHKHNIPVIVMNARLSLRSAHRYQKLGNSFNHLFGQHLTSLLCQSQLDADNFLSLGVPTNKITITGSLKNDVVANESLIHLGQAIKEQHYAQRLVYVAASTHQGEDEVILEHFRKIKQSLPQTLLVLIPRHPERFVAVTQLAQQQFKVELRSNNTFSPEAEVLIGDSMGEMQMYFAMADLVFMAGSIANIGGHNPLEAIVARKAVLSADIIFNFKKIYEELLSKHACVVCPCQEVAKQAIALLQDEQERTTLANNGFAILQANRGATERTLQQIAMVLKNNLK